MKISGVYQIQNISHPERIYIGSGRDVINRKQYHWNFMKTGQSNTRMQIHYNQYGIDDFHFTILEECSIELLREREQYYIKSLMPFFNLHDAYNNWIHKPDTTIDVWTWWTCTA